MMAEITCKAPTRREMSGKSVRGETAMRRGMAAVAVASAAVFASTYQCGEARAASFDCAKASGIVETLICTNTNLSQMDNKLAAAYLAARLQSANPQQLMLEERAWISERNQCQTATCISEAYAKRLAEIEGGLRTVAANQGGAPSQSQPSMQHQPPWDQLKAYQGREKTVLEQVLNYTSFADENGKFADGTAHYYWVDYWVSGESGRDKCALTEHHYERQGISLLPDL